MKPAQRTCAGFVYNQRRLEELLEDNRRIQTLLREKGYNVTYHETGGAHNYTSRRNNLGIALETMFG